MRSKKNVFKIIVVALFLLLCNAGLAFAAKDSLKCSATGYNNLSGAEYILPGGWIIPNRVSVSPGIEAGDDTSAKIQAIDIYLDTITVSLGTASQFKYIKTIIIATEPSISKAVATMTDITASPIKFPVNISLYESRNLYLLVQIQDTVPAKTEFVFTIDSLHAFGERDDGTFSYQNIDPKCPNSSSITVKMKIDKLTTIGTTEANNMYPSGNFIIPAN
nr:hypothetical protein [bacterium]